MTGSDRLPAALLQVARETFGIERLHDAQRRVIARVLAGEDTLALMPSGSW